MEISRPKTSPAHLSVLHLLAQLLEGLEHSALPVGAEQYRSVVRHLVDELVEVQAHAAVPELSALLSAYPAMAELYENLNYQHAGLCRSPLALSLDAEQRARKLIDGVRHRPTGSRQ